MQRPRRNDLHEPRRITTLGEAVGEPRPVEVIKRLPAQPIVRGREHRDLRGDHRVARILHLLVMRAVLEGLVRAEPHGFDARRPHAIKARIGRNEGGRDVIGVDRKTLGDPVNHEGHRADFDPQSDVAVGPPMQRLKHLGRRCRSVAGGFPHVAPTGNFAASIEGPAGILIGEMRREIGERLLASQQKRTGRLPRQPQRFGVDQPHRRARATGNRQLGKSRGQFRMIEDHLDFRAGRDRHRGITCDNTGPTGGSILAPGYKHV